MRGKPFLVLLLTIAFLALGVVEVLYAVAVLGVAHEGTIRTLALLRLLGGIAYILIAYELYSGTKWGWFLALMSTILGVVVGAINSLYSVAAFNAVMAILLLAVMKHYGIGIKTTKPPTPVPPPSAPAVMATIAPHRSKRFVRRKHKY